LPFFNRQAALKWHQDPAGPTTSLWTAITSSSSLPLRPPPSPSPKKIKNLNKFDGQKCPAYALGGSVAIYKTACQYAWSSAPKQITKYIFELLLNLFLIFNSI
jgi:hypothetical protein